MDPQGVDLGLIAINAFIAVLIGSTGIGGVFIGPAINLYARIPLHVALPACSAAMVFSAIAGTLIHARRKNIAWRDVTYLTVGAAPAAFLGSVALTQIQPYGIQLIVSALAIASGLQAVFPARWPTHEERVLGPATLLAVGTATGFLSALTGTGGPMVLLPILLMLRIDAIRAVGVAQFIPIPIGVLATLGNLVFAKIDLWLVGALAISLIVGSIFGAVIARNFSVTLLRLLVAILLILAGITYGLNARPGGA